MVKLKKEEQKATKKTPQRGKKEVKRIDTKKESTDVTAIASASKWDGRKIAKVR